MRTLEEALTEQRVCPHCGAPITSEICSYCGTNVADYEGMTSELTAEYPTLDCKMARFSFFGIVFPLIFFVAFGSFGTIFPIMFIVNDPEAPKATIMLACLPFALVGLGAGVVFFRHLIRAVAVSLFGEKIKALVYGYMDDVVAYNGNNGKVVKLLIDTPHGKRFIFLPLEKTNKPYKINSTITLKHYKNWFKVASEEVWE